MEKPILASQKDKVYEWVQRLGLETTDFEWSMCPSIINGAHTVSFLKYKLSNYSFIFDFSGTDHWAHYSPGKESLTYDAKTTNWANQLVNVQLWLFNLKREVNALNLWDKVNEVKGLLIDSSEDESLPYTDAEWARILPTVEKVQQFMERHPKYLPEHEKTMEPILQEIRNQGLTSSRLVWRVLWLGFLMSMMLNLAFNGDESYELYQLGVSVVTDAGDLLKSLGPEK